MELAKEVAEKRQKTLAFMEKLAGVATDLDNLAQRAKDVNVKLRTAENIEVVLKSVQSFAEHTEQLTAAGEQAQAEKAFAQAQMVVSRMVSEHLDVELIPWLRDVAIMELDTRSCLPLPPCWAIKGLSALKVQASRPREFDSYLKFHEAFSGGSQLVSATQNPDTPPSKLCADVGRWKETLHNFYSDLAGVEAAMCAIEAKVVGLSQERFQKTLAASFATSAKAIACYEMDEEFSAIIESANQSLDVASLICSGLADAVQRWKATLAVNVAKQLLKWRSSVKQDDGAAAVQACLV